MHYASLICRRWVYGFNGLCLPLRPSVVAIKMSLQPQDLISLNALV